MGDFPKPSKSVSEENCVVTAEAADAESTKGILLWHNAVICPANRSHQLRERLQNEKKAIEEAGPSLQAELSKIGDELSVLNLSRPGQRFVASDVTALSTRVKSLETKLASLVNDLTARSMSISSDIESSLTVSERKAKSLDELYREANAENEALYERFNDELGRVLKAVKGGQGVEEMRVKMKEAQDEAARLKKENARLKRENLGLRSQLRGD